METIYTFVVGLALAVNSFLGFSSEPVVGVAPTVLKVQQGGTGASTFAVGDCLKGNGTGPITTGSCGTGGGGSGTVSTSTNETPGRLAYWTSNSGTPALLGEVATTTVTASSPLSLSNTVWKVGGSNSVLSIDTSGAWTGNAGTATALAADPANCSAGSFPLGITTSGAVESCTDAWTEAENTAAGYLSNSFKDWNLTTNTFSQSSLAPTTTLNIHVSGVGTSTFKGGIEAWRQISAPYFHGTSTATSTFAGGLNLGTNHITVHGIISDASDGLHIHAGNGTEVGLFGAGNTANALLYGGLNVTGNLAVLTGSTLTITDITSALTLTGAGGIVAEYTGTSCTNQFVRSLSALGVATCATVDISADTNLTAGTGITLTGDDLSIDTSQNITTLSNLTTNGLMYTSSSNGTLNTLAHGTGGQVLAMSGGIPAWVATTTFSGTAPISASFSGGVVTIACSTCVTSSAANSKWATSTNNLGISPNGGTTITVGIGTTTPVHALTVSSSTRPQLTLTDGSLTGNQLSIRVSNGNYYFATTSASTFSTSTAPIMAFDTNGTLTLGKDLPVASGGTGLSTFGGTNHILYTSAADTLTSEAAFLYNSSTNLLTATNASTTNATVSGYFETPAVRGGTAAGSSLNLIATLGTGVGAENVRFTGGTNGATEFARFQQNGFGIGTTSPRWALTIASSTRPQIALYGGSITTDLWTMRSAGGSFYLATSSASTFATSTAPSISIDTSGRLTFRKSLSISNIGPNATTTYMSGLFDKSFLAASTTPSDDGSSSWSQSSSATSTFRVWNPSRAVRLVSFACRTDANTLLVEIGTGSASSTLNDSVCKPGPSGLSSTTVTKNIDFPANNTIYISFGSATTSTKVSNTTLTTTWTEQRD